MRTGSGTMIRTTAVALLLALLATACGARLSEDQRAAALAGTGPADGDAPPAAGAAVGAGGGGIGSDVASGSSGNAAAAREGGAAGVVGDGAESRTTGAETAASADADVGTTPTSEDPPDEPAGQQQAPPPSSEDGQQARQPTDTRAAPPGGNGGATDIGVTEDTIVLGNVSDVSGPVPGIFEPSQLAVKAYIAYFTAREGTIYGRQLEYLPKDSRLDNGANRSASIEVCEEAFMAVGSMSAHDTGGAPVIDECGIPDVRTASTTNAMQAVDNAYPVDVSVPGVEPLSGYKWFADQFPDAVTRAAFLMICGEVTEQSTGRLMAAQEAELGFEYVYDQCIEIQETNYAPFVASMKDKGVEYVAFQGAYQQAARLAQAMRQQDYWPTAYVLQSNAYNQNMLELAGEDGEGAYFVTGSAIIEEIEHSPELQLYAQWLEQVAPGERPTGLGMYSWSAAKLTVELLKAVGPNLTRERMIEALEGVDGWTGGGLHGPEAVGPKTLPSDCYNVLQIQGGRFVKVAPPDDMFACGNVYYDTR